VVNKSSQLRAFVITFDTIFGGLGLQKEDVVLSTAVENILTHWQHLALWLMPENTYGLIQGDEIMGEVSYIRESDDKDDPRRREYTILMRWRIIHPAGEKEAGEESIKKEYQQSFCLH
jgi:hypothetical protein